MHALSPLQSPQPLRLMVSMLRHYMLVMTLLRVVVCVSKPSMSAGYRHFRRMLALCDSLLLRPCVREITCVDVIVSIFTLERQP